MPDAADRRRILLAPCGIWAALVLLGGISLGYALVPGLPFKLVASLVIFIAQAGLVLVGFMRLGKSSALVRTTALAGVVWLSFLFLMTFADLWTR
jgi:caa(3)-type oxidase subunit IV